MTGSCIALWVIYQQQVDGKNEQVSSERLLSCSGRTLKTHNCFLVYDESSVGRITAFLSSRERRRRRDQDSETDCFSPAAVYELHCGTDVGRATILTLGGEELFKKDKRTLRTLPLPRRPRPRQRSPCPRHLSPCPRCPPARWPWSTSTTLTCSSSR